MRSIFKFIFLNISCYQGIIFSAPQKIDDYSLSKTCDQNTVKLICNIDNLRICKNTYMTVNHVVAELPNEMTEDGFSPIGIACGKSQKNNRFYFIINFGALDGGCSFCEWFYLYDD